MANAGSRNLILKSRQLGFTTFESIDMLDDCLFNKNFNALLVSYDRLSSLDIFDSKIDFAWKNLDPYLRRLYLIDSETKNTFKFDFGDGSYSIISVRSSGRSGTYHRLHVSEFAKICMKYPDKAKEVLTGTLPAVPLTGRADIESTAEGSEGDFYHMFTDAWGIEPEYPTQFKAHFYNWAWDKEEMSHIEKDIPDEKLPVEFVKYKKEHNLTQLEISYYFMKWLALNKNWGRLRQEYPTTPEEAFEGALEGSYYVDYMNTVAAEGRIKEVSYDKNLPVHTAWDLGLDDENVIIFFQLWKEEIRIIDVYSNNGQPIPFYAQVLKEKGYNYGYHYVPWDARIKNITNNKSALDMFFEAGMNAVLVPNISVIDGINAVRDHFARIYFDKNTTEGLRGALKRYRKEWDDKRGTWKDKPHHGPESHWSDAFRYMVLSISNFEPQKKTDWYDIGPGTYHTSSSDTDFGEAFDDDEKYEPLVRFDI